MIGGVIRCEDVSHAKRRQVDRLRNSGPCQWGTLGIRRVHSAIHVQLGVRSGCSQHGANDISLVKEFKGDISLAVGLQIRFLTELISTSAQPQVLQWNVPSDTGCGTLRHQTHSI